MLITLKYLSSKRLLNTKLMYMNSIYFEEEINKKLNMQNSLKMILRLFIMVYLLNLIDSIIEMIKRFLLKI